VTHSSSSQQAPLKVLFVTAEAYPFIKTGGLGDVAGALPPVLNKLGVDVRLLMPAYGDVLSKMGPFIEGPELGQPLSGFTTRLLSSRLPGTAVPVTLIDCPALYARPGSPYQSDDGNDWPDNHLRFALLNRVATLIAIAGNLNGWQPNLVHVNDWHSALVPLQLRNWGCPSPKTVFTIHNIQYQGLFPSHVVESVGLPPENFHSGNAEFWGRLSFMKAGIVNADCLTTVSPTYARTISMPGGGSGLDGVIAARHDRVIGIINGIDDEVWNPATDKLIHARYSADHLDIKKSDTADLRRAFGLDVNSQRPLAIIVSRFVEQKGIDVVLSAIPGLMRAGIDLAVLGTGERALERGFAAVAAAQPDRVAARIGYDEALAHRMFAGGDIVLVPSRFEPCGLTQLYGQRYGTLPVVHNVGGLADTVHDHQDGFSFDDLSPQNLTIAVERAVRAFDDAAEWRHLQIQAMTKDLGWNVCARRYHDLYQSLVEAR
jgi:starch synthase